jgi:hypothetical protein
VNKTDIPINNNNNNNKNNNNKSQKAKAREKINKKKENNSPTPLVAQIPPCTTKNPSTRTYHLCTNKQTNPHLPKKTTKKKNNKQRRNSEGYERHEQKEKSAFLLRKGKNYPIRLLKTKIKE